MTELPRAAASPVDYPPTSWALVERAADAFADHVLLADDYGRTLTGSGLRDAARAAAAGLHDLGVGPGSVVSWQLPSTLEAMVVKLALARLGAVQNPIIPVLREREVAFITAQLQSEYLLVPEEWRGFSHGAMARALADERGLRVVICDHATDPTSIANALRLPTGDLATLPPPPDADDVRWVYYSSGTTAEPKGIRHTDASVMASASGPIGPLAAAAGDVYPLAIPMTHIGGMAMLTASLCTGMRLVLFDGFDPGTTPERMAAHGATVLGSAVPFYVAYMDAQERHGPDPLFARLRVVTGGGAQLPEAVNQQVREVFGVPGVVNSWGLTEFPVATYPTPDDPPECLLETVGPPVPGVTVRVVGDDERERGPLEEGELRLKGPQCFAGYADPSLDADAFDADGWFRTSDLGLVDADGNVRVTGRIKDIIIRNAENVSAIEVEEALLRHPAVADVAVIGIPDPRTGERVCAVVVVVPGASLDLPSILEHCGTLEIARYKTPERLEIVDDIPRNSMGKVLKGELRSRFGFPEPSSTADRST
ncbi:MAG: AMP-binding protein [Acidimicrobiia bacterium]|jgi:acyl-CoA synthetase (AMP-forming)/AMP-acid ligase II